MSSDGPDISGIGGRSLLQNNSSTSQSRLWVSARLAPTSYLDSHSPTGLVPGSWSLHYSAALLSGSVPLCSLKWLCTRCGGSGEEANMKRFYFYSIVTLNCVLQTCSFIPWYLEQRSIHSPLLKSWPLCFRTPVMTPFMVQEWCLTLGSSTCWGKGHGLLRLSLPPSPSWSSPGVVPWVRGPARWWEEFVQLTHLQLILSWCPVWSPWPVIHVLLSSGGNSPLCDFPFQEGRVPSASRCPVWKRGHLLHEPLSLFKALETMLTKDSH